MIVLRHYEIGDERDIKPRAYEQKFIDRFGYDALCNRYKPEWSFTAIRHGAKIAIGGIYIYWDGVAEVFLWLSPEVEKYPLYVVHTIKHGLDSLIKEYKLHRLQTIIDMELPQNQRFCKIFGFEQESIMRKYDPWGNDCFMYARII